MPVTDNMTELFALQASLINNEIPPQAIETCIHTLVQQQTVKTPEALAVSSWDGELSYSALDALSSVLATRLLDGFDLRPGQYVALAFPKSKWQVVAMLGVMKTGGAFVNLDPEYPSQRVEQICDTCDIRLMLCASEHLDALTSDTRSTIPLPECLSSEADSNTTLYGASMKCGISCPADPIYCVFTSGSTGTPKGIVISHRALATSLLAQGHGLGFSCDTKTFQFASYTWDASIFECIGPLLFGGCVCIPSDELRLNHLSAALNSSLANTALLTPTVARTLIAKDATNMKTLLIGGEAVDPSLVASWANAGVQTYNAYGPTECAVVAMFHLCTQLSTYLKDDAVPLGRPVGCNMWVVDPENHHLLAPVGAVGELLISGPTLADCYIKNPVKTEATFIDTPSWATRDVAPRLYKSGDLVRLNGDGTLTFVGRKDSQVKVNGLRIELGEVEYHLRSTSLINDVTVLLPKVGIHKGQLTAILSLPSPVLPVQTRPAELELLLRTRGNCTSDSNPGVDRDIWNGLCDIQAKVKHTLPSYMTPSNWIVVSSIPHNLAGKLDMRRVHTWLQSLPTPDALVDTQDDQHDPNAMPSDPCEAIILTSFRRVLGNGAISVTDDFILCGGDSIQAMQVSTECHKKGVSLRVKSILTLRTVVKIAREARQVSSLSKTLSSSTNPEVERRFGLSPIQSLYVSHTPDISAQFNQSVTMQVASHLDPALLQTAMLALTERHGMLRSRLVYDRTSPDLSQQYISRDIAGSVRCRVVTADSLNVMTDLTEASEQCLNMQEGPIWSATLVTLAEGQMLHMAAHHSVVDLVSWRIILDELESFLEHGAAPKWWSTVPLLFEDWVRIQQQKALENSNPSPASHTDVPAAPFDFWGLQPDDNMHVDVLQSSFMLGAAHSDALLSACNTPAASTTNDLLIAALFTSFRDVFGQDHGPLQLFNESHGRNCAWDDSIDTSQSVGWFTTLYPVSPPSSEFSSIEAIQHVKQIRHEMGGTGQDYFRTRYMTQHGRTIYTHHLPMEVLFNFGGSYSTARTGRSMFVPWLGNSAIPFQERRTGRRLALFEITITAVDCRLFCSFDYSSRSKHQASIQKWIATLKTTLLAWAVEIPSMSRQLCTTDFPLLGIPPRSFKSSLDMISQQLGLHHLSDVQDILPCTSMQDGLLIAQAKIPHMYNLYTTWDIRTTAAMSADVVVAAWKDVVATNSILRTVFVENLVIDGKSEAKYNQVVFSKLPSLMVSAIEGDQDLRDLSFPQYGRQSAQHRLVVQVNSSGQLSCRLDINHALVDGASMGLLVEQLQALCQGDTAESSRLEFSDLVAYDKVMPSKIQEEQLSYWRDYLSDAEPSVLPALAERSSDAQRLDDRRYEGLKVVQLGDISRHVLHDFCRQQGVTISSVFQVAWALCLRIYLGQSSVSFGYLVSRRHLPLQGIESALGPYISLLIRKTRIEEHNTIMDLLHAVQADTAFALEYCGCSPAAVLREDGRRLGDLINTSISYQRFSSQASGDGKVSFAKTHLYDPSEDCVSLDVDDYGDHLTASLTYWQSFMDDRQARRLAQTASQAVSQIVSDASTLATSIDIVPNSHIEEMMQWNGPAPQPNEACVHDLVAEQAKKQPDAIALESREGKWTYAELDGLSDRLAWDLIQRCGSLQGEFVPICFSKSPWAAIVILAILKTGAAYVPLDSQQPISRLETIIQITNAKLSLSELGLLPKLSIPTMDISADLILGLSACTGGLPEVSPNEAAAAMFTSGSTGLPKCVVLSHCNLCTTLAACAPLWRVNSKSRMLHFASYTFDVSMEEMFLALTQGACLCIPSDTDRRNNLTQFVVDLRVTWMDLIPGVAAQLQPEHMPSVQTLIVGGERMTRATAIQWANNAHLINCYGPSECSINATYDNAVTSLSDGSSIGRNLPSCHTWIVQPDNHNMLVPVGALGELIIEGPTVMHGYLGDAARTEEVIIKDPSWISRCNPYDRYTRRMYKTGDLVRWSGHGDIVYLGRKDNQRKLRGHRIDIDEIQRCLSTCPELQGSVVLLPKHGSCRDRLIALLCSNSSAVAETSQLSLLHDTEMIDRARHHLQKLLPAFMIPTGWAVVSMLPRLASEKYNTKLIESWLTSLDEKSIQAVFGDGNAAPSRLPSTRQELLLCQLCATVLGRLQAQISINQTFLSLGGDSISAMQLSSRASHKGLKVSVESLLRNTPLAVVAANAQVTIAQAPEQKDEIFSSFELSPIQRTFLRSKTQLPLPRFNLAVRLTLSRPVSLTEVTTALTVIVQRHSMLRAQFRKDEGRWLQQISRNVADAFTIKEHVCLDEIAIKAAIEQTEAQIDAIGGLQLAAALFPRQSQIFLTAHHLVVDAVSWQILISELDHLLMSNPMNLDIPLSFARWCHVQSAEVKQDRDEATVLVQPKPLTSFANAHSSASRITAQISGGVTAGMLRTAAEILRCDIVDLLLAATLRSYMQTFPSRRMPSMLNEGHGREIFDATFNPVGTVGWFTTMYPVTGESAGSEDFGTAIDTLHLVKDRRHEFLRNGHHWFTRQMLSENCEINADWLEATDILFNYLGVQQSFGSAANAIKHFDFVFEGSASPRLKRPAMYELAAMIQHDSVNLVIEYNHDLDNAEIIHNWIEKMQKELTFYATQSTRLPLSKSDFPLIQTSRQAFRASIDRAVATGKLANEDDIEDMYPCTAIQEGMLIAELRTPKQYATSSTFEIGSMTIDLNVETIVSAWQLLITRHSILRTYFVQTDTFLQVVLRTMPSNVFVGPTQSCTAEAMRYLDEWEAPSDTKSPALHSLVLCQTTELHPRIFCRLDLHHAIIDGMSMALLVEEFSKACSGQVEEMTTSSYRDLVDLVVKERPQSRAASLEYWATHMEGAEPCHFARLNTAPEVSPLSFNTVPIHFEQLEQLDGLCHMYGLTKFNVLQTAWSIVLHRYIGSESVCFGYLSSGRDRPLPNIEKAIGPYINLLPCWMSIDGSITIKDTVKAFHDSFLSSLTHQNVSLSEIQHKLKTGSEGLFNTIISYQKESTDDHAQACHFNEMASRDPSEFCIALGAVDAGHDLRLMLKYSEASLDAQQARFVAEAVKQTLLHIVSKPDDLIRNVSLVGPIQRSLIGIHNAAAPVMVSELVHEAISARAHGDMTDKIAVHSWDGKLTRGELDDYASRLANLLSVRHNLAATEIVALNFQKSLWTIVATMGVLKAGGCVVYLPHDGSEEELRRMITFTNVRLILTDELCAANARLATSSIADILVVNEASILNSTTPETPLRPLVTPADPSFMVFTSGSTGNPKAVSLTHQGVCSTAFSEHIMHDVDEHTRRLQFAAHTFDVAITDTISTLIAGGCVCIPSEHDRMNDLSSAIQLLSPNAANLTPTVARMLSPQDLKGMKTLLLGGEALTRELVESLEASDVHIINGYGPAEAAVKACTNRNVSAHRTASNIGSAIPSTRLWIVEADNHDHLAALGAVGELVIEGPGVATGYWQDPDRSLTAFKSDHAWQSDFAGLMGSRHQFFATGDLVRRSSDGTIDFLGRKGSLVKIHGQRVDITGLETQIQDLISGSWLVAVDAIEIDGRGKSLVAFLSQAHHVNNAIVQVEASTTIAPEIRNLQSQLTRSMKGRHGLIVVSLTSMPLTTSKKIHRQRLQKIGSSLARKVLELQDRSPSPDVRPQTLQEQTLRHMWARSIGVSEDSIGINDNFFAIGGDSVAAIKAVRMARNAGLRLTTDQIFKMPTIRALARHCMHHDEIVALPSVQPLALLSSRTDEADKARREAALSCGVDIEQIEDVYPCTPLQEGLFALSLNQPGAYLSRESFNMDLDTDLQKLQAAWQSVAAAAPILRTRFVFTSGHGIVQVVLKEDICWRQEEHDLRAKLDIAYGVRLTQWQVLQQPKGVTLCWDIHHALYDGHSRRLILDAVEQQYRRGDALSLSMPAFTQYISYADQLNGSTAAADFWRAYLADASAPSYPDTSMMQKKSWTKATIHKNIVAARNPVGVTMASVLQTALALTLAQHSDVGTSDVVFGMVVSGRDAPILDIDRIPGPCMSTIPVRVPILPGMTAQSLLTSVQHRAQAIRKFDCAGIRRISAWLPDETKDVCDLRTLLIIQPKQKQKLKSTNAIIMQAEEEDQDNNAHPYPLVIQCVPGDKRIEVSVFFDSDVLSQTEAEWTLSHFEHAVQVLLADNLKPATDVFCDHVNELNQIKEWNGEYPAYVDRCIHDLFSKQVSLHSDKVALDGHDGQLSYKLLDTSSTALAYWLQCQGIGPESKVALCFEKSIWAIVCMLAVLKAGGAYVPLDPTHTMLRLTGLITQVHTQLVLVGNMTLSDGLSETGAKTIVVDRAFVDGLSYVHPDMLQRDVTSRNTACIMFTSGSTGKPKGVVMQHGPIVTSHTQHCPRLELSSASRVLHYSSLTWDVSLTEIVGGLLHGATICVPSPDDRLNDIGAYMKRARVSWTYLTPTTTTNIINSDLPDLRTIVFGGEAISKDTVQRWNNGRMLLSAYGPTEAAVLCAIADVRPEPLPAGLVGRPVGGKTWLVDPSDIERLTPLGCVGEILITGDTVAAGYFDNDEQTKRAFVDPPEWHRRLYPYRSTKAYRTGDLGRYLPNGDLQYLGRQDSQLKINSQRVELSEVEHCMIQAGCEPGRVIVDVCSPLVRSGRKLLVTYFVHAGQKKATAGAEVQFDESNLAQQHAAQLRAEASRLLPRYMVPSLFVPVLALPCSTAGKIERKVLRAAMESCSDTQLDRFSQAATVRIAPATTEQTFLQHCWSKLLSVPVDFIGQDDEFISLGGDSVAAIKLTALAKQHDYELDVRSIMAARSLAEMATSMTKSEEMLEIKTEASSSTSQAVSDNAAISRLATICSTSVLDIEDAYPCTPLQEGLMALSLSRPGTYVGKHIYTLSPRIDLPRFQQAVEHVVQRHPILRTRIVASEQQQYTQVVMRHKDLHWEHMTLNQLKAYLESSVVHMDLGEPLTALALVHDGDQVHFCWTMHHAVYDAWSLDLLLRAIKDDYNGKEAKLSTPPFSGFVASLQARSGEEERFWQQELVSVDCTEFPRRPDDVKESCTDACLTREIDFVRQSGCRFTVQTLLRAAWAIVIAKHSGSSDVVYASVLSGRNASFPGIIDMAAPTFTTVPVRVNMEDENESASSLLNRVQKQAYDMIPYEQTGLRRIFQTAADHGSKLDLNSLLLIQSQQTEDHMDDELFQEADLQSATSHSYGITLECSPTTDALQVCARFDSRQISAENMNWILDHLACTVQWLGKISNEHKLSQVEMSPESERISILAKNKRKQTKHTGCYYDAFKARVVMQPDAMAIDSTEDGSWTYHELDTAVSQLSARLATAGVERGDKVPIVFHKSVFAITSMLAVIKRGASYVPVDPSDGTDRQRKILEATGCSVILKGVDTILGSEDDYERTVIIVDRETFNKHYYETNESSPAQPSDPAYVLFTSGSTGEPKGVVIDNAALVTSAMACSKATSLDNRSRVYHFSAYTWDVSVLETLMSLIHGACICVPTEEERLTDLGASIKRFAATWALLTPTVVAAMLQPSHLTSIETLALGGEAPTPESVAICGQVPNLLNAYGPTEACVLAAAGGIAMHNCIGYSVGCQLWIASPNAQGDFYQTPFGCVGELLISGGTLAKGYLNDVEKTAAAFVNPSVDWLPDRVYRTGDLARYNTNGSIVYMGRKDDQVKILGKRVELGEIENQILVAEGVANAAVFYPKRGPWKEKLVVALQAISSGHAEPGLSSGGLEILQDAAHASVVSQAKARVTASLPAYMVPQSWIPVRQLPRNVSGKLDRKQITNWMATASDDVYRHVQTLVSSSHFVDCVSQNPTETTLQGIWAAALNMPIENVPMEVPFTQFGGDSISAITVTSRAKSQGIQITAQDVLRLRTIRSLAKQALKQSIASAGPKRAAFIENGNTFVLSPIQTTFYNDSDFSDHFNQSLLLQLRQAIDLDQISSAIQSLVAQHPMLRARYVQLGDEGIVQYISNDIHSSYICTEAVIESEDQAARLVSMIQRKLDAKTGPIFGVLVLHTLEASYVFLTALHLVVDLVSWRIIADDLENILHGKPQLQPESTSFHEWTELQATRRHQEEIKPSVPHVVPDLHFWDMCDKQNTYTSLSQHSLSLSTDLSSTILGQANAAYGSDAIDILVAGLSLSFAKTFPERAHSIPPVFLEGHGRESWDASLDVTRTVGWFTVFYPCFAAAVGEGRLKPAVRAAKDCRLSYADRGRAYFARHANELSQMEISLNYSGGYQSLEQDSNMLQAPITAFAHALDYDNIGQAVRRPALIEVSVTLRRGILQVSFVSSSKMRHEQRMQAWLDNYSSTLSALVEELTDDSAPEQTLADYPLFDNSHDALDSVRQQALDLQPTSSARIEDIYPVSQLQKHMLNAQRQYDQCYMVRLRCNVNAQGQNFEEVYSKLSSAWQQVVDKHAALRSIFVWHDRSAYQVVFDRLNTRCIKATGLTGSEINGDLRRDLDSDHLPSMEIMLLHSNDINCKIIIPHTLCDATSVAVIFEDLQLAYNGKLQASKDSTHCDLISHHLCSQEIDDHKAYWRSFLSDAHATILGSRQQQTGMYECHRVSLRNDSALQKLLRSLGVTLATILQTAWALTLYHWFAQQKDITFGYFNSGRHHPVTGINHGVGLFMNLCAARVQFASDCSLSTIVRELDANFASGLPHDAECLAAMTEMAVDQPKDSHIALFDTVFNFAKTTTDSSMAAADGMQLDAVEGCDPMDFTVVVRVLSVEQGGIDISLDYWPELISTTSMHKIGKMFQAALAWMVTEGPDARVHQSKQAMMAALLHRDGAYTHQIDHSTCTVT